MYLDTNVSALYAENSLAATMSAFGYLPKQMRGLAEHCLSPDRLSPE
jgi:hypothetical protein